MRIFSEYYREQLSSSQREILDGELLYSKNHYSKDNGIIKYDNEIIGNFQNLWISKVNILSK